MAETTPQKAPRKPTARSRVTNGKLGDMDGRGKWARRFADLIHLYSLDVTDDPETLPATVQNLIRRAATLTVELERAEASFAQQGKADAAAMADYQTATNTLRRLLQDLQGKATPFQRSAPEYQSSYSGAVVHIHGAAQADRSLARAIAFMIDNAKRTGAPLPKALATFAVENGLADYAEDRTIEHE
ncbi:hypothetical protein GOA77_09160 [Sinorhizobium meliloti]|nr:hypothetical protein [Sinorhizobium meliloti]